MPSLTLTPEQLAALGLAGDEEVSQEKFSTALDAALAKASGGEEHGQQIGTLTRERDEAIAKLQEIEKAQSMAEVETLLAEYDMPEESAAAMKELALTNRDQAKALLGGMKKKEAPTAEGPAKEEGAPKGDNKPQESAKKESAGDPPAPVHDPKGEAATGASDADRKRAIEEYRKSHPEATFQSAWTAVQRMKPELFQGAAKAA